jgi:hypothetical protein
MNYMWLWYSVLLAPTVGVIPKSHIGHSDQSSDKADGRIAKANDDAAYTSTNERLHLPSD